MRAIDTRYLELGRSFHFEIFYEHRPEKEALDYSGHA